MISEGCHHFPHLGWLDGMIAYIAMAKPNVGRALRAALDEVARP